MTDNEIIKAIPLEDRIEHYNKRLKSARLIPKLVDLINRQKAEIENYSHNNKTMTDSIYKMQKLIESQKAEIERLEAKCIALKALEEYVFNSEELKLRSQIVHCIDCAKSWTTVCGKRYCSQLIASVGDDDFCSFGERKGAEG